MALEKGVTGLKRHPGLAFSHFSAHVDQITAWTKMFSTGVPLANHLQQLFFARSRTYSNMHLRFCEGKNIRLEANSTFALHLRIRIHFLVQNGYDIRCFNIAAKLAM